ncbi:MAG: sulfurtransferase-like selenium metabolism protein YedF [Deltaproteobacteria bacterium]|nr:sulfurtransferase-like selenium metabolism protein YedF [Deltaproteobacteria bacterium]
MTLTVDARTLACPEPVVLTNKAIEEADNVTTVVDNDVARENVKRFARNKGFQVSVEEKDGAFHIHMTKGEAAPSGDNCCESTTSSTDDGPIVLFIAGDGIGSGSDELGKKLMTAFVQIQGEVSPKPKTIILMNSGVKLVCDGSQVIEDLRGLAEQGVEILACGTCLGYYDIKETLRVGTISNMFDIAQAMMSAAKVVAP